MLALFQIIIQKNKKLHCPICDNLISVFTDSQPYTEYIDVGQLV